MNYKDYLIAEGSNNKRAVLYAYLAYSKAVSSGDESLRLAVLTALSENTSTSTSYNISSLGQLESPFEEEVYQALVDEFGENRLHIQMPFAGFRIDIVYNSDLPDVPKIAIECDGAKYHSSREAYLYDIHRQKILESHGFVFHRIWSTNWWRNYKREAKKLIDFIKTTENSGNNRPIDNPTSAQAFNDNITSIENYAFGLRDINMAAEIPIISSIDVETTIDPVRFDKQVSLYSKVRIKYLNNDRKLKIHIVDSLVNRTTNGIQKVNVRSVLATSLLGHREGDIVKVGPLDNYVEIIEIEGQ